MEIDFGEFENIYNEAKGYHRRVKMFVNDGMPHSLIFNLASVALERYLVALCELHGEAPLNHSYISLMNTVDKLVQMPRDLSRAIRKLDFIFGICPIDNYFHGSPTPEDAEHVVNLCGEISKFFDPAYISDIKYAVEA